VVFFLQPLAACWDNYASFTYPFSGPPDAWDRDYYPLLYSSILEQAKTRSLPVTNLGPIFKVVLPKGAQPFNSHTHLNGGGNKLMASILYRSLEEGMNQK